MLTREENDALCRVGPGTLMGDMVRQYWLPFYLSSELAADGPPVRVRLVGEDLIAFRATSGEVGLAGQHCPHRGASLFFGRNEEEGLRCVYHGWKFDVAGNCVDMPNEPAESNFKHKIHHTASPCRERNGVVWTYMGPLAEPPELPHLEWNMVPEAQVYHTIRIADNNFLQTIEGEYDSTHIGFLHQILDPGDPASATEQIYVPRPGASGFLPYLARLDKSPVFETVDTEYGVLIATRRNAPDDSHYWRVYPFLLPFHTLIPPNGYDNPLQGHAWIPMDDEHTICLCFTYHPTRPLSEDEQNGVRLGFDGLEGLHPSADIFHPPSTRPYGKYWPKLDNDNDFMFDYEAQRTNKRYSGLPGIWPQDSGMQQSMGFIYDRTKEHLGVSDSGQIRIRHRMLSAARALRKDGTPPPGVERPGVFHLRPAEAVLPRSTESSVGATRELYRVEGAVQGLGTPAST